MSGCMDKRRWLSLAIGVLFAVVFLLPLCTYQVRYQQVAIVSTLGKAAKTPVGPGLHAKLPWPIQKVTRFDQYLHVLRGKFEETPTKDQNLLVMNLFLAWRIDDPAAFMVNLGTVEDAERVLSGQLSTSRRAVLSRHPLTDLITTDAAAQKFGAIEQEILDDLRAQHSQKSYGLQIVAVGIEQLALPENITRSVFDRMREERNYTANGIRLKAAELAAETRATANEERDKILARAEGEAKRTRGEGDMAAAKAYQEFQKDPDFALFLRKLESLSDITKNRTTIVIDRDVLPFDLLGGPETAPAPKTAPAKSATGAQ